jgi:hypothetical protein
MIDILRYNKNIYYLMKSNQRWYLVKQLYREKRFWHIITFNNDIKPLFEYVNLTRRNVAYL